MSARLPRLRDEVNVGGGLWPQPEMPSHSAEIGQEIKGVYPTDLDPAVAAQTAVSHIFLSRIAELVPITLKRMPRLSEPG